MLAPSYKAKLLSTLQRISYHQTVALSTSFDRVKQAILEAFNDSDLPVASEEDVEVSKDNNGNYVVVVLSSHPSFLVNKFLAVRARIGHRFSIRGQIKVGSAVSSDNKQVMTYRFVISDINPDKV